MDYSNGCPPKSTVMKNGFLTIRLVVSSPAPVLSAPNKIPFHSPKRKALRRK